MCARFKDHFINKEAWQMCADALGIIPAGGDSVMTLVSLCWMFVALF